jgi:hypothetical protein
MLYDPEVRAFDGPRLRLALIARELTPGALATKADLEISSVYNALNSRPVRMTTALKIFRALDSRPPMDVVYDERAGRD